MAELPPRITGTEMEWGLYLDNGTPDSHETEISLREIIKRNVREVASLSHLNSNGLNLSNGARFYVDVGQHFEYATPEDTSFWGTAANEISGEHIITQMLKTHVAEYRAHKGRRPVYELHKRVADDEGETWGYHENYFMPSALALPTNAQLALMSLHLVSRQVFTGAGYQHPDGQFRISQKLHDISVDYSEQTTGKSKPLVNRRDEAHVGNRVDSGKRLHITSGDPNMSPWVTFMKLATTSVVLRLIEAEVPSPVPNIGENVYQAANMISSDPSLTRTVTLNEGYRMTALDMQECLLNLVRQTFNENRDVQLPAEEVTAVAWWQETIDELRRDPRSQAGKIEWLTKYLMLMRKQDKAGGQLGIRDLQRQDRQWDAIREDGTGIRLRDSRWQEWTDKALIEERIHAAPTTTRAHVRGRFVKLASQFDPGSSNANWDFLSRGASRVVLPNPYATDLRSAEELFSYELRPSA